MELVLAEWGKDFREIREQWTPEQFTLHLKERNNRIRRENGQEAEKESLDMDDLREIARQRARAMKNANRNQPRRAQ